MGCYTWNIINIFDGILSFLIARIPCHRVCRNLLILRKNRRRRALFIICVLYILYFSRTLITQQERTRLFTCRKAITIVNGGTLMSNNRAIVKSQPKSFHHFMRYNVNVTYNFRKYIMFAYMCDINKFREICRWAWKDNKSRTFQIFPTKCGCTDFIDWITAAVQ